MPQHTVAGWRALISAVRNSIARLWRNIVFSVYIHGPRHLGRRTGAPTAAKATGLDWKKSRHTQLYLNGYYSYVHHGTDEIDVRAEDQSPLGVGIPKHLGGEPFGLSLVLSADDPPEVSRSTKWPRALTNKKPGTTGTTRCLSSAAD